jgi:hypothetical protein
MTDDPTRDFITIGTSWVDPDEVESVGHVPGGVIVGLRSGRTFTEAGTSVRDVLERLTGHYPE